MDTKHMVGPVKRQKAPYSDEQACELRRQADGNHPEARGVANMCNVLLFLRLLDHHGQISKRRSLNRFQGQRLSLHNRGAEVQWSKHASD